MPGTGVERRARGSGGDGLSVSQDGGGCSLHTYCGLVIWLRMMERAVLRDRFRLQAISRMTLPSRCARRTLWMVSTISISFGSPSLLEFRAYGVECWGRSILDADYGQRWVIIKDRENRMPKALRSGSSSVTWN